MKIGFSTSVIQRGKTGVAQYVLELLRAMRPHTATHHFKLFVLEEDLPLFEFARSCMQLVSVPESYRPAIRNIAWHQAVLPRLVKELGIDVLHVPSYRRMLWPRPCPLVATIHDLAPFHVRGKYDWKRTLYGRVIVKRLARRQNEIIAVSEHTARDLERFFGIARDKVTVIWNGIDHQRFQPGDTLRAKTEVAARWNLNRPFFLYISRLEHPAKNHVRLIEAFNSFKADTKCDWMLALCGSDWHGAEIIHAAAKGSPFSGDIRLTGYIGDELLPDLYRAAEVFVYPSLFEGFGMPPIEAMACGCPVISSACGALADVVAKAALIVEPDDTKAIAAALTYMAGCKQEQARWREAGLRNARRFDWQSNAAQTLAVYASAKQRMGNT
jgi:glycosyltransferase involved in cell wall biosynthesis